MSHGDRGFSNRTQGRLTIRIPKFTKFTKFRRYRKRLNNRSSDDDDEPSMPALNHNTGHWMQGRPGGVGRFMATVMDHKLSCRRLILSSNANPVPAVLVLTFLWVCLYSGSLVGGDLHTVIGQLGRIGACFFSAMACFLAAIYVAMFSSSIPVRTRIVLLAMIIVSWNLMFLYDHGGNLKHHGAYNMLVFVVFVIPAVAIAGVEYALCRIVGWRKLVAVHLPILIVGAAATTVSLHRANQVWDQGFRGERLLPLTANCKPVDRGLPWVDILPHGAQNFWADTLTCSNDYDQKSAKALDFHVNLTMDGALTASCNASTHLTYTPLPSTLDWPKVDKLVEEAYEGTLHRPFNKLVMEKIREAGEVPYKATQTVALPPGVEAAIVRCGAVEKLVARVRPTSKAMVRTSSLAEAPKLDVTFLFLDATSRRGFHRRLRRTVSALEEVDAKGLTRLYQFFRYNVMSFCTEANSRAMFQGTSEAPGEDWVSTLWEDFANSGWVTLYTAGTCQDLNAAYMNRKADEERQCFDHELVSPFCHSDFFAEDSNPFGNFKGPYSITARCLKGQHVHEHELEYLKSFQSAYPHRAKFSVAWFLEGHEGTTEVLRHLDDGLAAYVRKMTDQDWNRTALIIAADHGLHMGLNFGLTQNGAVEHKNPMLAVMLPPWFADQENRHKLMRINQQRLVTGLDLYRTLQGIRLAGQSTDTTWVDEVEDERSKRGIDLQHSEVPETRNCIDAEIPATWCQCL